MNLYELKDAGECFLISAKDAVSAFNFWAEMLMDDWNIPEKELTEKFADRQHIKKLNDMDSVTCVETNKTRCAKWWAINKPNQVVLSTVY